MLDKLETELKEIAKKILNPNKSIDLDQISRDILVLYEKIIIYKHSTVKQPNILKTNELIKKEFEASKKTIEKRINLNTCLLYTSPSPRDKRQSRMPSSA